MNAFIEDLLKLYQLPSSEPEPIIKWCKRCIERLPLSEAYYFSGPGHKYISFYDGYYCADCIGEVERDYESTYGSNCLLCGERFYFLHTVNQDAGGLCDKCKSDYTKRELKRVRSALRRTRQLKLESTLSLKEWLQILKINDYRCIYCGSVYEHMDHVIPVILGGGTTAGNCVPSCKQCNLEKGADNWEALLS